MVNRIYDNRDDDSLTPRGKSKYKDTKRYCRGKVGKPHTVITETNSYFGWSCRWNVWWVVGSEQQKKYWSCLCVQKCSDCGKILQQYVGIKDCVNYPKEEKDAD